MTPLVETAVRILDATQERAKIAPFPPNLVEINGTAVVFQSARLKLARHLRSFRLILIALVSTLDT